ncbi:AMP-binding protein [Camelimonas abortus]|uniref:AMP-binding protein n=1 Tax=Camelimonas abortus TaxID=1017184 RepID=A0ABV7LFM3_9HYPH
MTRIPNDICDAATVSDMFLKVAAICPDNDFLVVGPLAGRAYLPEGRTWTYAGARAAVDGLAARYRAAGYGPGHRVAVLLENRPEHFLHFLALNRLGVSLAPVNPDYRPDEMRYLLEHSEATLLVALPERMDQARRALALCERPPALHDVTSPEPFPPPRAPAAATTPGRDTETCLYYTSGTTGRPKGCVTDNEYYLGVGLMCRSTTGMARYRECAERIYNPLPLFHINAGVFSFMAALATGGAVILPDRFHPQSWWRELIDSHATIAHYLGVIPGMLIKLPPTPEERAHGLRFMLGAGVEPEIHEECERRFNAPLVELWGMTETGGGFIADTEPRMIHTRAIGRPLGRPGIDLEARVVDENDNDVPAGREGQLLVRRCGDNPRLGMFREYLKNPEATAEAWRGGWFHTGDVVRQDETGMLYFVDRNRNIIRRSGENIAAAEVEATLLAHPEVAEAAVIAAPGEVREQEVFACIRPRHPERAGEALATELFDWTNGRLAYYKPPGWILFLDELPKTSTQKVQKTSLFPPGADPRQAPGVIDLRARKKRG